MTLDDVIAVIAETDVVPQMDTFDAKKSFEDNGVDSLDTYTILLALEEKTGLALEEVPLEEINTAEALHAFIVANKA